MISSASTRILATLAIASLCLTGCGLKLKPKAKPAPTVNRTMGKASMVVRTEQTTDPNGLPVIVNIVNLEFTNLAKTGEAAYVVERKLETDKGSATIATFTINCKDSVCAPLPAEVTQVATTNNNETIKIEVRNQSLLNDVIVSDAKALSNDVVTVKATIANESGPAILLVAKYNAKLVDVCSIGSSADNDTIRDRPLFEVRRNDAPFVPNLQTIEDAIASQNNLTNPSGAAACRPAVVGACSFVTQTENGRIYYRASINDTAFLDARNSIEDVQKDVTKLVNARLCYRK